MAGNITQPLDATCNWWGSADGPGGAGPGSGDALLVEASAATALVSPWATTPVAGDDEEGCGDAEDEQDDDDDGDDDDGDDDDR